MSRYPKELERNMKLNDGTHVLLRPEIFADAEMLWEMFSTLSQNSLRYLIVPFPRERIEKWTSNIKYEKNITIFAVIQERAGSSRLRKVRFQN